jgi:hypothetical protein
MSMHTHTLTVRPNGGYGLLLATFLNIGVDCFSHHGALASKLAREFFIHRKLFQGKQLVCIYVKGCRREISRFTAGTVVPRFPGTRYRGSVEPVLFSLLLQV